MKRVNAGVIRITTSKYGEKIHSTADDLPETLANLGLNFERIPRSVDGSSARDR